MDWEDIWGYIGAGVLFLFAMYLLFGAIILGWCAVFDKLKIPRKNQGINQLNSEMELRSQSIEGSLGRIRKEALAVDIKTRGENLNDCITRSRSYSSGVDPNYLRSSHGKAFVRCLSVRIDRRRTRSRPRRLTIRSEDERILTCCHVV